MIFFFVKSLVGSGHKRPLKSCLKIIWANLITFIIIIIVFKVVTFFVFSKIVQNFEDLNDVVWSIK